MFSLFRKKRRYLEISPDEAILDAEFNEFKYSKYEGYLNERTQKLPGKIILGLFLLMYMLIGTKLYTLQIKEGVRYTKLSQSNYIKSIPIFSERGIITDRYERELAWNEKNETDTDRIFSTRKYYGKESFSLLGFVGYPKQDKSGNYWQSYVEGRDGIEKIYDGILKGIHGKQLYESSVDGNLNNVNVTVDPQHGANVELSLDRDLNSVAYNSLAYISRKGEYQGGAMGIMDIDTGEILSYVNYPSFSPYVMSTGKDYDAINTYNSDTRNVFLNRMISGVYTPGSIVKMVMGLAALNENIVNENTTFKSTGKIEIPNPYDKEKPTFYRDWRENGHGLTDIYWAIADSVNTYFYIISGGYKGFKGLGIAKIDKYLTAFGFGQITGIDLPHEKKGNIPSPDWKQKNYNDGWRLGDTYISAIGQFGFSVTPIQALKYVASIANNGNVVIPHLRSDVSWPLSKLSITIPDQNYIIIKRAMRETVQKGTAHMLKYSQVAIAAKSGTAQVGVEKKHVNSWGVGFFPYDKPKFAFVVMLEKGRKKDTIGALWAMKPIFDEMIEKDYSYIRGVYREGIKKSRQEFEDPYILKETDIIIDESIEEGIFDFVNAQ